MKILVACEESQRVTEQFRLLGHEAYSNDILPTSGNHPEWHLLGDSRKFLYDNWDMLIAFPPCTYLTVTGNSWFNIDKYGDKAIERYYNRFQAVELFMEFALSNIPFIAIENPIGIMSSYFRKPDQIIEPYMFGDPFEKKTCLWLKNLPCLIPDNIVEIPPRIKFESGKTMPSWYADLWYVNKEERSKIRSKTFPGIARAMAEQWGYING